MTSELIWQKEVNKGGLPGKIYPKNTHASSTVATDGKHVYLFWGSGDRSVAVALDHSGKKVWSTEFSGFNSGITRIILLWCIIIFSSHFGVDVVNHFLVDLH